MWFPAVGFINVLTQTAYIVVNTRPRKSHTCKLLQECSINISVNFTNRNKYKIILPFPLLS